MRFGNRSLLPRGSKFQGELWGLPEEGRLDTVGFFVARFSAQTP